jgi:GTP cyclohydrolase I
MVPFFGEYYFGYVPNKKIIGLSKVARIVDHYSSKLQVQERLTKEIVNAIAKETNPKGIILILKARHLCKEMRGVKKVDSEMITSEITGTFKKNSSGIREEFMSLVKLK